MSSYITDPNTLEAFKEVLGSTSDNNARGVDSSRNVRDYWSGYNDAIADMLENVKGKDPKTREETVGVVTTLLERQRATRGHGAVKSPTAEREREVSSHSPEDRILNAMAGLMEQAATENSQHREAIAASAARVTEAVKGIKEVQTSGISAVVQIQEQVSGPRIAADYNALIAVLQKAGSVDAVERVRAELTNSIETSPARLQIDMADKSTATLGELATPTVSAGSPDLGNAKPLTPGASRR